jgi:hypothetical protein
MTRLKVIVFYLVYLKISLGITAQTSYQNFIPNGSFDSIISTDFTIYPDLSQHDSRWIQYASCAGYFLHTNSNIPLLPVTSGTLGYVMPQKGGGVYYMTSIGNSIVASPLGCTSECQGYLQIKLYHKLKTNKKYRGRFYVSRVDSLDFATSRIGMFISDYKPNPITISLPFVTPINLFINNVIPQIQRPFGQPVIDDQNWTQIENEFTATTNMEWMTLGNFYRLSNTDTVRVTSLPNNGNCFNEGASYYFDNLSLVEEDCAVAYKDTTKNYLCIKQGTSKVLGDTAIRPWLQYTWRNKNNSIVGTNRNYTYTAAFIENTFFTVEIKDTGEYAFITKAIDTIFIYTSVSPDTVNCEPVGLQDILKDAEEIEMYYSENQIKFNQLHERFVGSELVMKSIDGKVIYKRKLERKKYNYPIQEQLSKGFYFVEVIYENNSIRRKKVVVQ